MRRWLLSLNVWRKLSEDCQVLRARDGLARWVKMGTAYGEWACGAGESGRPAATCGDADLSRGGAARRQRPTAGVRGRQLSPQAKTLRCNHGSARCRAGADAGRLCLSAVMRDGGVAAAGRHIAGIGRRRPGRRMRTNYSGLAETRRATGAPLRLNLHRRFRTWRRRPHRRQAGNDPLGVCRRTGAAQSDRED